ncbi:MAG: response regulator [candidate division Zixibacteria bacterium]|nr:response regulator [candidate division Zixibacteria bacterium]
MGTYDFSHIDKLAKQHGVPFKILIVDDEEWMRKVFGEFCSETDAFDVDLAVSGSEAVEKMQTASYDLVTLDLIMPEISGLDVLHEIKQMSPHTPVMIVTGNATDRLVKEAGVLGACRVLYKPVRLEDFIESLASALER